VTFVSAFLSSSAFLENSLLVWGPKTSNQASINDLSDHTPKTAAAPRPTVVDMLAVQYAMIVCNAISCIPALPSIVFPVSSLGAVRHRHA
jgi:hypothetical protein